MENGKDDREEPASDGDDQEDETTFYSDVAEKARQDQERRRAELDRQRQVRETPVPFDDGQVRSELRARGEPIQLFGEDAYDRRERLRLLIAQGVAPLPKDEEEEPKADGTKESEDKVPEEFYTEGSQALKDARTAILMPSLQSSKRRLAESRKRQRSIEWREEGNELYTSMQKMSLVSSQVGDTRPLSSCALSAPRDGENPTTATIATGSWTGDIKLWDPTTVKATRKLAGHTERLTCLAFHPRDPDTLVSGSADKTIRIWSLSKPPGQEESMAFKGHADRVSGLAVHPHGALLASASFDATWRLWDLATGTELLLQEGHSKAVYRVAHHPDGSLVASGGMDRATRVWDMRSGKCIMTFTGHIDSVLGVDFSGDGAHLATGSGDNSIKIWDLRKRRCFYTIAAHASAVSMVKYQPDKGFLLISTSFDRTAKIWSRRGYVMVGALANHEEKVTCGDIAASGQTIVTTCYDKTWKLWSSADQF